MSTQEHISKLISDHRVIVTNTIINHLYCKRAKELLKSLDVDFFAVDLNTRDDGKEIQDTLAEMTGQKTVPNIFINGKHIGGCDTLTAKQEAGELLPLLQ